LVEVAALRPSPSNSSDGPRSFKVIVFASATDRERVLAAAFAAGAGRIGAYTECSFAIPGEGTFFGSDSSNPVIGQKGRRETVPEYRLEVICDSGRLVAVLDAVRRAHSYEEPAIDVYPLQTSAGRSDESPGVGRVGRLPVPMALDHLARRVGQILGQPLIHAVGEPSRQVSRIAIVCGAGDDFLGDADRAEADVLLTGEARFHRGLEAESLGIGLIVAGHHATERIGVENLAAQIASAFPELAVWPSRHETDPFRAIGMAPR
jgi:hypothetical protein